MGEQAALYRQRKIVALSNAEHEQEFYTDPVEVNWCGQPCHCQWTVLKRELLQQPDPPDPVVWACACTGPSCIVPGYPHDKAKMRAFAEGQEERYLCNLMLAALSGSGLVNDFVRR